MNTMAKKKIRKKMDKRVKQITVLKDFPTISACMIVKNEEKLLPQCLESIKDYVDEIIIVDTGSTDRTVEIAKSYGAKVYHHPWEDDFSKHRNQSISYATSEWVFIIDADEVLEKGSGKVMREVIKNNSVDSYFFVVKSAYNEGVGMASHNSVRLFQNGKGIHYKGRVHNRIVGDKKSLICPIYLIHYGYDLGEEINEKKFERTANLLKKEIEENPEHPRAHHYLSASYLSTKAFDMAIKEALTAIELSEKYNHNDFLYLWSHFIAGFSYINTGKYDEAETISLGALTKYPDHLDSHYLLSQVYLEKKQWDKFFIHSNNYFRLLGEVETNPGKFGPMVNNTFNHRWKAHLFSGYAFLETGNDKKAGGEFESAIKWAPDKGECHWLMGRYFKEKRGLGEAGKNLDRALEYKPEDKNILLDKASVCRILEDSEEERRILERLLHLGYDDTDTLFPLANLYLHEGRYRESIELYERILESDKSHPGVMINIGLAWRKLKRPGEAINYLNEAVKISPLSIEANSNLAYAYYESMDFESARKMFLKVCQIDNDLEDIHLYLAIIYLRDGEIESCVTECDNVLRILDLPRNEVINEISDIQRQFIKIGNRFKALGKSHLASLSFSIAGELTTVSP